MVDKGKDRILGEYGNERVAFSGLIELCPRRDGGEVFKSEKSEKDRVRKHPRKLEASETPESQRPLL